MLQPIPLIHLPIQPRLLHINILIPSIEINILNRRRLPRLPISNRHLLEKRRRNEIHILPRIREDPHHSERLEGAHRAAVVVPRYPIEAGVELAGDVEVGALGGFPGAPSVVVEEDVEEGLLVADVRHA